jgi:hypothetical protein
LLINELTIDQIKNMNNSDIRNIKYEDCKLCVNRERCSWTSVGLCKLIILEYLNSK